MAYTLETKKRLSSLAPTMVWLDFRSSKRDSSTGGRTRLTDLSGNGNDLWNSTTSSTWLNALNGWGTNTTWGANFTGPRIADLGRLFDGTPCAIYMVHSVPEVSGFGFFYPLAFLNGATVQTSSPSRAFSIALTDRAIAMKTGSTAYQQGTTGAIPVNQYVLEKYIVYGSALGNPTVKMVAHQTVSTINYVSWTTPSNALFYQRQNNTNVHYIKMMIAYDLSGKNKAQIDAFDQEFYQTLIQDTEYASLLTAY